MTASRFHEPMTIERRGRAPMSEADKKARAARFKALRESVFDTQQAFAEAGEADIDRTYVSKFESGESLITTSDMQERVARVFKIAPATLKAYLEGRIPLEIVRRERHQPTITLPAREDDRLPPALVEAIDHHPMKDHVRFQAACTAVSVLRNEKGLGVFTAVAWADLITQTIRSLDYGELQSTRASRTNQDVLERKPRGIGKHR